MIKMNDGKQCFITNKNVKSRLIYTHRLFKPHRLDSFFITHGPGAKTKFFLHPVQLTDLKMNI